MTSSTTIPPGAATAGVRGGDAPVIRTVDLTIDYGSVLAVRDLSLTIGPGEVYGLIGPNGAGKTSTIRALATLLEPTYGEVYVDGHDVALRPEAARAVLGYMPDMPPVYDELTCWELLDVFAGAHGLPPAQRRARVDACLEQVNLTQKRDAKAGTLSRGMKQRLILAKTLLHDPKVLLLDEPASGLDPMARIELRELLKALGRAGKAVLVSSHILTELSDFCTSIGIMQKGRMVVHGTLREIIARMSPHRTVAVRALTPLSQAAAIARAHPKVVSAEEAGGELLVQVDGTEEDEADLLAALLAGGVRVRAYEERKMDVEDIFLSVGASEVA